MTWLTFLPAVASLGLGIALGRVAVPLHPLWSARLIVTVAATTVLGTIGPFAFVAVNYAAGLGSGPSVRLPQWALIAAGGPIPAALGLPAVVITCASLLCAGRFAVRRTAEIRTAQNRSAGVLDTDVPIAVAVPGRRGGVLVSRGLLGRLSPAELQVVFQHERSHLRHRHHRYLAVGALSAGVLPPLGALNGRLRFALERWADEEAAEAVGDRVLVANTIARVALARSSSGTAPYPAFADSEVVARVEALLGTPPGKNLVTGPFVMAGTGLTTSGLASTALQLDHILALTLL